MKAAVYTKHEAGKVVEIVDIEQPVPKAGEVLIKVRAASVNPFDWRMKVRRPGVDVAGEVIAAAPNATRFKPGDAVFGACKGAFAEFASARETRLAIKPDSISFEQAASVPVAGLTALQGLRDKGRLQPGQKVLINGAAGGVGTFSVQIAKALGAELTGVCSTSNVELVRSLGADLVTDYTQQDFTREARLYDLILDNVGNRSLAEFRRVLTPGGRCILVGAPKQAPAVIGRVAKAMVWSCFLRQTFLFFIAQVRPQDLITLSGFLQTGKLTPVIDRQYPLSDTGKAIAYVEGGHARGKVVVHVS